MTPRELESVLDIWDGLAEFNPSESDAALHHLFEALARLLRADNVLWLAAVRILSGEAADRDPGHGWRVRSSELWRPHLENQQRLKLFKKSLDQKSDVPVGLTTTVISGEAGRFRVHRLRDGWIDFKTFKSTPHYELFYTHPRIDDRLWVVLLAGSVHLCQFEEPL